MCASNAPIPTTTLSFNPRRLAHSDEIFPAGWSDVYVSRGSSVEYPSSRGSIEVKNSFGGKPLNSSAHNALCPAAHRLLLNLLASDCPVKRNGIQSQCSTNV